MPPNIQKARDAGFSDDEIFSRLGKDPSMNLSGALEGGFTKKEILDRLQELTPPVDTKTSKRKAFDAENPITGKVLDIQEGINNAERNSALFNWGDEAGAAGSSGNYDANREANKAKREKFAQEYPIASGYGTTKGFVEGALISAPIRLTGMAAEGVGKLAAKYAPGMVNKYKAARASLKAGAPGMDATIGLAGRLGANATEGAGYSALAAAGEADPGQRMQAATDAAPTGAAFGAGLGSAVELAGPVATLGRWAARPFTAKGREEMAAKFWQKMHGGASPSVHDPNIPGYRPMTDDPGIVATAKQMNHQVVGDRLSENAAALQNTAAPPPIISAPGREANAQLAAKAQTVQKMNEDAAAAAAAEKSSLQTRADAAKDNLSFNTAAAEKDVASEIAKIAPSKATENAVIKANASIAARSELDRMKIEALKESKKPWDAAGLDKVSVTIPDGFENVVTKAMPHGLGSEVPAQFVKQLKDLSANKSATGLDVQRLLSDVRSAARQAYNPTTGTLTNWKALKEFEASVLKQIDANGLIAAPVRDAWNLAIKATKDYHLKWENPRTGKMLDADNGPSHTLESNLNGPQNYENIDELLKLSTLPDGTRNPVVIESIKKWLAHDLAETIKGNYGSTDALNTWINKNSKLFEKDGSIKAVFGNVEKAQKAALNAAAMEKNAEEVSHFNALADKVSPPNKLDVPDQTHPFVPKNPNDPKGVFSAINAALVDVRPNSMSEFNSLIGSSADAKEGARQALGYMMLNKGVNGNHLPHEFFDLHKKKMADVFEKSAMDRLEEIAEASRKTAAQIKIRPLDEEENASILTSAIRPAWIAAMKPFTGYFGAVTGANVFTRLAHLPVAGRNKLILRGILDPNGFGKTLNTPINKISTGDMKLIYNQFLPVVSEYTATEGNPEPVQRKARGGPVRSSYIHPAISKMRSNRMTARM